jgi:heat shock protein HslJ
MKLRLTSLSLPFILLLSACASEQAVTAPSINLEDLQTPRWSLTKIDNQELDLASNQKAPSLSIDEALMASGYSGCNNYFAELNVKQNQIKLARMNSTMKLCLKDQMDLDNLVSAVLSDWSNVYIDRGVMVLSNAQHTLQFKAKRK